MISHFCIGLGCALDLYNDGGNSSPVVKRLGRSFERRIFNPDAIPVPDVEEQLQPNASALQLRSSALRLLGVP